MVELIKINRELHYTYKINKKEGAVIIDGTKMKGEPKIYFETTENDMIELTATEAFHLATAMIEAVYGLRLNNRPYQREYIMPGIPGKRRKV